MGIDLVEIARIHSLQERRGRRFLDRVFTEAELESCLARTDPAPSLAARFAAKEAAMKALGTGWAEGIGWKDLEVVSAAGVRPHLDLKGRAADRAANLGVAATHLSLSHDGGVAGAVVILESREGAER